MIARSSRPGFVFLLSVLAVGVIGMATVVSLLLLGGAAERSAASIATSIQAIEYANTCAERAIRSLKADLTYIGDETIAFDQGTCTIRPIGGAGNDKRLLCTEGFSGNNVRRMEIRIDSLYPRTLISQWREVTAITLCQ